MYTAQGFIRSYDPPSDTATVELAGLGIIDTWIAGIKIDVGINRAACVNGAIAILSLPDPHRICEATISAVPFNPASIAPTPPPADTGGTGSGAGPYQTYQNGRESIRADVNGAGSLSRSYTLAFASQPHLSIAFDAPAPFYSVTSNTPTGFALSISAGNAYITYAFNWTASS